MALKYFLSRRLGPFTNSRLFLRIVSFRQAVNATARGNDDRVFLIGASPYNDNVEKIIQLSLNTFEEHEVTEIPRISPCGIVRMESMSHVCASFLNV